MKIINNISPLPFYTSLEQQHHRKPYAFGQIYPLIVQSGTLLPFQVLVDFSASKASFSKDFDASFATTAPVGLSITKAILHKLFSEGMSINPDVPVNPDVPLPTSLATPSVTISTGLFSVIPVSSGLYLIKFQGAGVPATLTEGPYYLELQLTISSTTYSIYSEIFTSVNDTSGCIRLEYSNSRDLEFTRGLIDFSSFAFIVYIDSIIGKPRYEFEEEATERMGYTFIESQISKKVHRFTFIAPEYLCDALRIVRLCDTKIIEANGKIYDALTFAIDPKWEEQGDLASVECEFETDLVISNIGNYE